MLKVVFQVDWQLHGVWCNIAYIMQRTQVMLEEWQYQTLKSRSERQGRSMSDLVREILSAALYPEETTPRADWLSEVAGIGSDPEATGEDHDRFLYGDEGDVHPD